MLMHKVVVVSGLDKSIGTLLKGRCNGCVEK